VRVKDITFQRANEKEVRDTGPQALLEGRVGPNEDVDALVRVEPSHIYQPCLSRE
jgi:hypothetical protein